MAAKLSCKTLRRDLRMRCFRTFMDAIGLSGARHEAGWAPLPSAGRSVLYRDVAGLGGAAVRATGYVRSGRIANRHCRYWDRFTATRRRALGMADAWMARKAIGGAAVALCLVRHANRDGHSMRTFEVPAIGACMLVEDTAEHREIFGPSLTAVEYVTTPEDAVTRLRGLLAAEPERRRLKERVHQLVCSRAHTWTDRLKTMLATGGTV